MVLSDRKMNRVFLWIIWIFEGILVGFGAILPGISGGVLCTAFGMYHPLIETISHPKAGLKKHGLMLGVFCVGVALGFVGLSGLTAKLLSENTALMTCVFIGFILGTLPDLWQDAGKQGRSPGAYLALALGLAFIVGMLFLFKTKLSVEVAPNFLGFILCGVLWGLSFIVPGLSSSSLLLFFGLYQPMLGGISTLDFRVIAPMALGMIACVLLFSKGVGLAYKRFYAVVSHALIGIVLGSTLMILPPLGDTAAAVALSVLCIAGGAAFSFFFTWLCNRIKAKTEG